MKKTSILLILVMIISNVLLLTSCGKTEDKLLGTWEYKISSGDNLYASSTYTFRKSGDQYTADLKMGSSSGTNSFSSTYEVEGNVITFTLTNGNTIAETFSLSGNTLTIDGMEYTKR